MGATDGVVPIVMCKAPIAGRVKTRLIGSYSADEVARLYAEMAQVVIARAARLFGTVVVAADEPEHPFFSAMSHRIVAQGEGDLGARMQRVAEQLFAEGVESVMLLGADAPHMPDQRLIDAERKSGRCDVVIGPVEDGGYDLLLMRRMVPIFENIAWSTSAVLEQTEAQLEWLGISYDKLPLFFDIDREEDLQRSGWDYRSCP